MAPDCFASGGFEHASSSDTVAPDHQYVSAKQGWNIGCSSATAQFFVWSSPLFTKNGVPRRPWRLGDRSLNGWLTSLHFFRSSGVYRLQKEAMSETVSMDL